MKALLKTGMWVEIDTTCLFNDQYNTTDGKRIFDAEIVRIVDDVRSGLGKCRYCGAIVKIGEEELHYAERENKLCEGCFWYRDALVGKRDRTTTESEERLADGKVIRQTIITTVETYERKCSYKNGRTDCTLKECRAYGIEWFTPENTFFLAHPDGFPSCKDLVGLEKSGFIFDKNMLNAEYKEMIGTYHLIANIEYDSFGFSLDVFAFRIWNCVRDYTFRYDAEGCLFTYDRTFGWKKVSKLKGVPTPVMRKIRDICGKFC